MAVTQPADISKVCGNQVKLFLHLPGSRHKRCVSQRQGDVVLTEHIRKSGVKPGLVANLDYKFVVGRKLLQEECQYSQKIILLRKFLAVEQRKLKHHRTKLWTKKFHRFHELLEF